MASDLPNDNNSNTKSEQETIAFHKKRARRVSFAENTSVHIFNRDEDSGTPVNPKPPNSPSNELSDSGERSNGPNQLLWSNDVDDDDNDGDEDDDDDEDVDEPGSRSPFLRFVGSPSSGGSTIGSANSNDEDNFFGPVSANFIRRDLLDSVPSDDNHDQTMDSTAFSMHFRSLARSESDAELKTSTTVQLSFDEKTPTQDSIPTKTGTLMQMTQANKPDYQPSVSTSKLKTGSDSNDMSIVGEYRYKYDYAELSPTLDALLAEGNKDLRVFAASNGSVLKSPRMVETAKENGTDLMDFSCDEDSNIKEITTDKTVNEVVSVEHNDLVAVDGSKVSPSKNIALDISSDAKISKHLPSNSSINDLVAVDGSKVSPSKNIALNVSSDAEIFKHLPSNSSIMVTPIAKTTELVKDMSQIKSSLRFPGTREGNLNPINTIGLDDIVGKEHKSPFQGALNSSSSASPFITPSAATRSNNHSSIFVTTFPSIQKSISKLRMLEASPFSAVLNAKLEDSISKSVFLPSKMTPLNTLLERNHKSPLLSCMKGTRKSASASQKKRERASSTNVNNITFETPINVAKAASPLLIPPESNNNIDLPENEGYSSQKKLKLVNTSKFESSPLRDAKQFTKHNELVTSGPVLVAGSGEKVTNASPSRTATDSTNSLFNKMIEQSDPLISTDEEMVDIREGILHEIDCISEPNENSTTLLNGAEQENNREIKVASSLISPDEEMVDIREGILHEIDCISEPNENSTTLLNGAEQEDNREIKVASSVLHGRTDNQSCQKDLNDQFCQSPSNKKPSDVLHDENTDSVLEENVPSPSPHCLSNEDEISSDNGILTTGQNIKHLTEINAIVSEETKELLSQSVDNLNLHAIDRLTNIMDHLRRSKTYQLLSDEIKSQKSMDVSIYNTRKRVAEVKQLLCNFVHEKAKSQLLHMKRERLLKREQSLASRISESEVLRADFTSRQQALNVHSESSSANTKNLQESQIESEKVTSMGHTLNQIDSKIADLTKSFHKSCKMKGEPSSDDTLVSVNKYMMKQARCQIIQKDLQLWSIDKLENINRGRSIVLNYLDLMTQRFTVNTGSVPSISISLELNNLNINSVFKDMDVFTAFEFVFNAGTSQKEIDASSLAKETQVTGSRFGNMLNVAREIQQARLELNNLVSTRFRTPSVEQLDLELCFFDSKRRRKITLTLNISCLKRGIYPSEIVPYQTDLPINDPQSSSSSGSIEIASVFQDLNVGYFRIQRLCRLFSELISPPIR